MAQGLGIREFLEYILHHLETTSMVEQYNGLCKTNQGTSLVAQWIRICLTIQETQARSLVKE